MKIGLILVLTFLVGTCHKTEILDGANCPTCIQSLINSSNPPLEVWQYSYNNQTVYLVKPDCCDQYEQLYSTSCSLICAPSGGITGKGDGKCTDFEDVATNGQMVWKAN